MTNNTLATHALYLKCSHCENTDIVLIADAPLWKCPFCAFEKSKSKTALHDEFDRMNHLICKVERLNEICEDNMKRLNSMMLELKGIIAMVRPMAKKNEWYGDEIAVEMEKQIDKMNIPPFINLQKTFLKENIE